MSRITRTGEYEAVGTARLTRGVRARPKYLLVALAIAIPPLLYLLSELSTSSHPPGRPALGRQALNLGWNRVSKTFGFGLTMRFEDGVAYVDKLGWGNRHPIDEMMARGRQKAEELERKKQGVRTFHAAVLDYRAAFGMDPPEGFREWYNLALRLDAPPLASLYPLAHTSVLPFLALPPALLRKRVRDLIQQRAIFSLTYDPLGGQGKEIVSGDLDQISNFKTLHLEWRELSKHDARYLPPNQDPDEPITLAVWVDDMSHHPPSARILQESRELAHAGQVWRQEELEALEEEEAAKRGWGNACDSPSQRAIGQKALQAVSEQTRAYPSFVDEPLVYADPCRHPEHLRQNGEMIMKEEWAVKGLLPLVSLNAPVGGGEIIGPTTVGRKAVVSHMPWIEKTESRLWWRGNPNSAFIYDQWDWRSSQRFKLSDWASGRRPVGAAQDGHSPVLLEIDGIVERKWVDPDVLRGTYLNVSLVNSQLEWACGGHYARVFFCDDPDGGQRPNCPDIERCYATLDDEYDFVQDTGRDKSYESKHKFRLDVDGFAWTTRWREELSKNNVVIKVTLYPEWWSPQAIPWYHYIPGRYDFADLYDIMAYFTGTPAERAGRITPSRQRILAQRDRQAEEIAARGRDFAMTRLRWEDMRVYMFLLLIEYRRAWSDDRQAATLKYEAA